MDILFVKQYIHNINPNMSKETFKTIQAELTVSRKQYLTPHYIRVWLTGNGIEAFADTTVGEHNKILIPPKGIRNIHFPYFDPTTKKWIQPSEEVRPITRTYTHRGFDLNRKEIWIDFVAHGEEGPASAWAINAKEGDILGVMMKSGKKELFPIVDHYVLIGDATGIPVLSAILENLPATAKGICIIDVYNKEDEQPLPTAADIHFEWLHSLQPGLSSQLPEKLKSTDLPEENRYAHIAAEYSSVKEIRRYLRDEKNFQREELDAYAYWKFGASEDKSTQDRKSSPLITE